MTVKYWYCRIWRSWAVALYDAEDNQIGEATWSHSKEEALNNARDMSNAGEYPVVKLAATG